jgi:regulator of RNase E activity RraA
MEEGLKAIRVVEEAPAGSVIVACLDQEKDFAVFGPTFATLAKSRRLGGFVIDGAMRGVTDLRRIGVPVYARGTVAGSAGGHYRLASVNEATSCGGAIVAPGDIIVGDEDGVAVVPGAGAKAILEKAAALRDEKEAMLSLIAKLGSYTKAAAQYRAEQAGRAPPARRP